jgi:hypothetical protein
MMDRELVCEPLNRVENLRRKVSHILRSQLTYPKTILSLLRDRRITDDQLFKMVDLIDESILLVDAQFAECLMELRQKDSNQLENSQNPD